jgi:hypothetical protein
MRYKVLYANNIKMLTTLPTDQLITIFSSYLRVIDIVLIKTINKECSRLCDEIIEKKIKTKLETFSIDKTYFGNDCRLSGSSVLQILLDEEYETDLDIFILENKFNETIQKLLDCGYVLEKDNDNYPYEDSMVIKKFNEFKNKDNKLIQLIVVENIDECINNFDINIVQNYYNGINIKIKDPVNIVNKQIIKFDYTLIQRNLKYIIRGFELRKFQFIETSFILKKIIHMYMVTKDLDILVYLSYILVNNIDILLQNAELSAKNIINIYCNKLREFNTDNKMKKYKYYNKMLEYENILNKYNLNIISDMIYDIYL